MPLAKSAREDNSGRESDGFRTSIVCILLASPIGRHTPVTAVPVPSVWQVAEGAPSKPWSQVALQLSPMETSHVQPAGHKLWAAAVGSALVEHTGSEQGRLKIGAVKQLP